MKNSPTNNAQKAAITFYYIAVVSYTICLLFFLPDNLKYSRWGILTIDTTTSIIVYSSLILFLLHKITFKNAAVIYVYSALLNIIFSSWVYFYTLTDYSDILLICTSIYCINLAIGGFCINYRHAFIAAILYFITIGPLMAQSDNNFLNSYWIIINSLIVSFGAGLSGFLYLVEKAHNKELKLLEKVNRQDRAFAEEHEMLLKSKLELRQKELLTKTMYLAEYAGNTDKLIKELKGFKTTIKGKERKTIDGIINAHNRDHHEQYWKEFETSFHEINSEFKRKLYESCPDLSPAEYKLASFIHLGLSSKQIASLSSNTIDSIEVARSRLRNKLKLPADISLKTFLLNL